ncbi:MAG: hypothetical protein JWM20_463 [Patescibacteria group bacterium]|nr:hypothetical protein [Patescibacteria group bacterium]
MTTSNFYYGVFIYVISGITFFFIRSIAFHYFVKPLVIKANNENRIASTEDMSFGSVIISFLCWSIDVGVSKFPFNPLYGGVSGKSPSEFQIEKAQKESLNFIYDRKNNRGEEIAIAFLLYCMMGGGILMMSLIWIFSMAIAACIFGIACIICSPFVLFIDWI